MRQVELAEMVIGVFLGILAVAKVVVRIPAMLGGDLTVATRPREMKKTPRRNAERSNKIYVKKSPAE